MYLARFPCLLPCLWPLNPTLLKCAQRPPWKQLGELAGAGGADASREHRPVVSDVAAEHASVVRSILTWKAQVSRTTFRLLEAVRAVQVHGIAGSLDNASPQALTG